MSELRGRGARNRRDRPSGLSGPQRRPRGDPDRSGSGPQPPGLGPERRSSPRLAAFEYIGTYAYGVTLNTAARHRAFEDRTVVHECLEALTEACAKQRFVVHAYCFMPNHLHLLVEGSEGSSKVPFMKRFKQLSGYRYRQRASRALWHRSYYDHVLRREEDLDAVAEYIWNNPVRAGLVQDREASSFSGPRELMGPDRPEGLSLRVPTRVTARRVP